MKGCQVHASCVTRGFCRRRSVSWLQALPEPAPAWTTVKSVEGDLRLFLAVAAARANQGISSPAGKLEQRIYFCRTGGSLFVAQQIRYPAPIPVKDTASRLAAEKKGYLQGKAELVAEQPIVIDGIAGEEFTYKAPSPRGDATVTSKTRHLFKGPFYYTLTVMSPPNAPATRRDRPIPRLDELERRAESVPGDAGQDAVPLGQGNIEGH